ncbi:hypothetical protein D5S17_26030 [Pseudonocardiaceae bacterium YIM PH 21723]|nr:hypothetical protein D5S17_26030 [Pseudonocardiaceae bacterium YIM PH 21723]
MGLALDVSTEAQAPLPEAERRFAGPRWWYAGLAASVVLAACLRLWRLNENGFGNLYYSAAALSMSQDPLAFLFGALDTNNFITVDKPAIGIWPQAIAVTLFGLNWATALLPTALFGIASVHVLAQVVRLSFGADAGSATARVAGLLAALGLAICPIAVASDRGNNPDAFMVLVLLLAALVLLNAIRTERIWVLACSAALIGLAFNVKMLQAYLVLPAFAVTWLFCARTTLVRRLIGLLAALLSLLAASAAWMASLYLVPPDRRAFIGGSTDGSALDLVLGYNGASRIVGAGSGQVQQNGGFGGPPGAGRFLHGVLVEQVSWLLPLAVLGVITVIVARCKVAYPGLILLGGWSLVLLVVFSQAKGTFHPYYTTQLAPAVVGLAAIGLAVGFSGLARKELPVVAALAVQLIVGIAWIARIVSARPGATPDWMLPVILTLGAVAVLAIWLRNGLLAGIVATLALSLAPFSWAVVTAGQPLVAPNPLAGHVRDNPIIPVTVTADDQKLADFLTARRGDARWIGASVSAMGAVPLTIASGGRPVMAIGGFLGKDPALSPEQLAELVRTRELRFVELGIGWGTRGVDLSRLDITPAQRQMLGNLATLRIGHSNPKIQDWVRDSCQHVDPMNYGGSPTADLTIGLFDCGAAR